MFFVLQEKERGGLMTYGLYSFVRHPMYTSLLTCFWSHPEMVLLAKSLTRATGSSETEHSHNLIDYVHDIYNH